MEDILIIHKETEIPIRYQDILHKVLLEPEAKLYICNYKSNIEQEKVSYYIRDILLGHEDFRVVKKPRFDENECVLLLDSLINACRRADWCEPTLDKIKQMLVDRTEWEYKHGRL